MPKFDFLSQFSMSKIIRIFLNFLGKTLSNFVPPLENSTARIAILSSPHQFLAGTLNYFIKGRLRLSHWKACSHQDFWSSVVPGCTLCLHLNTPHSQKLPWNCNEIYRTIFDWCHRQSRLLFQLEFPSEFFRNYLRILKVVCFSEKLAQKVEIYFGIFQLFS